MNHQEKLPDFATAAWYKNPDDHRCPHDAWLESLAINEPSKGPRNEERRTTIIIKLLGAYHDGHIILRYQGVRNYSFDSTSSGRGMGDWLTDTFSRNEPGLICHRIIWAGFDEETQWTIEAEGVNYEWLPKSE